MKAIELFGANLYPGIRLFPEPFLHVALGCSPGKRNLRIPIGTRDVQDIVTTKKPDDPNARLLSLITDVNVLMVDNRKKMESGQDTELRTTPLIVKPAHPNDDRVLVKWAVPSGPNGRSEIVVGRDVFMVGLDVSEFHDKKSQTREVLCVLKPHQKIEAHRTGERILPEQENGELTWDGYVLKVKFGLIENKLEVRPPEAPLHNKKG